MLQIAGKPVENVQKALETVETRIKDEKRFKVLETEIIEPELDEETTLYSGLIETQIKFEDAEKLMEFIVDYTPNSIEIEDPSELKFDSVGFTAILNDMSNHLLKTNMKVHQAMGTIHVLNKKLQELKK